MSQPDQQVEVDPATHIASLQQALEECSAQAAQTIAGLHRQVALLRAAGHDLSLQLQAEQQSGRDRAAALAQVQDRLAELERQVQS